MADIVTGMPSPVFAIDWVPFASRAAMVEVIAYHLKNGAIVQIEDGSRPRRMRLCYEIRPSEAAFHAFNAHDRQIGISHCGTRRPCGGRYRYLRTASFCPISYIGQIGRCCWMSDDRQPIEILLDGMRDRLARGGLTYAEAVTVEDRPFRRSGRRF